MAEQNTFLDRIGVAEPCEQSWDGMRGDDRVRYCGECKLNVYNLSALSRREAEDLVRTRNGRLCVKFFRRADGTLVTDECGRVRRALRRKAVLLRTAAAALFALVTTPLLAACGAKQPAPGPETVEPAPAPSDPVPAPTPVLEPETHPAPGVPMERLGRIALPTPPPGGEIKQGELVELMGDVCLPEELVQPDPPK